MLYYTFKFKQEPPFLKGLLDLLHVLPIWHSLRETGVMTNQEDIEAMESKAQEANAMLKTLVTPFGPYLLTQFFNDPALIKTSQESKELAEGFFEIAQKEGNSIDDVSDLITSLQSGIFVSINKTPLGIEPEAIILIPNGFDGMKIDLREDFMMALPVYSALLQSMMDQHGESTQYHIVPVGMQKDQLNFAQDLMAGKEPTMENLLSALKAVQAEPMASSLS